MPERAFSLVSRRIQILKYFWMRYSKSKARDHLFWVSVETLALFQQFAVPASGARLMGTTNWRFLEYFYSRLIDSNLGPGTHRQQRNTEDLQNTSRQIVHLPRQFFGIPMFFPAPCLCLASAWVINDPCNEN